MHNRKKWIGILLLGILILFTAAASAVEYPVYGACTGTKVNVRKYPDEMYPSLGQLICRAPVVILGEKDNAYLCSTWVGEGYVPKQYIKIFENMTAEEFAAYKKDHPNEYRKTKRYDYEYLLELYNNGKISKQELLQNWYCEPGTGYTGLEEKDGKMVPFRRTWW